MKILLLLSICLLLSLSFSKSLSSTSQTKCARVRGYSHILDFLGNNVTKFLNETGDRSESYFIPFPTNGNKFCTNPQVHVSLDGINIGVNDNPVISLTHSQVNTTGFIITVSTIQDAVIFGLSFSYVALNIPNRSA